MGRSRPPTCGELQGSRATSSLWAGNTDILDPTGAPRHPRVALRDAVSEASPPLWGTLRPSRGPIPLGSSFQHPKVPSSSLGVPLPLWRRKSGPGQSSLCLRQEGPVGRPIGRWLGRSLGRFPTARKPGALVRVGRRPGGDCARVPERAGPGCPQCKAGAALPLLLVGNAGRPGLCQGQVLETVCLPRSSLRAARGCRGWSGHTKRSSGASASLHPRARADEEVAQGGTPCGLRSAPLAAAAALHRLPPRFPLTSWRTPRFPGSRRPGPGNRRQRAVRAGRAWAGPRTFSEHACRAEQGLHEVHLHRLTGKARPRVRGQQDFGQMREAPQPRCVGGAPRNKALVMQVHEHTRIFKREDSSSIH